MEGEILHQGRVVEIVDAAPMRGAAIVDERADRPHRVADGAECRGKRGGIGEVAGHRQAWPVAKERRGFELGECAAQNGDAKARLAQGNGDATAKPLSTAGNKCDLAGVAHAVAFSRGAASALRKCGMTSAANTSRASQITSCSAPPWAISIIM